VDVIDFVETYIAHIIDILWVTASAGIVASLSFAEWQRSEGVSARLRGEGVLNFLLASATLFLVSLFLGGWYGSIPVSPWALLLLAILSALSITHTIIAMRRWMQSQSRREIRHTREADV
jgi:hypothetical protein